MVSGNTPRRERQCSTFSPVPQTRTTHDTSGFSQQSASVKRSHVPVAFARTPYSRHEHFSEPAVGQRLHTRRNTQRASSFGQMFQNLTGAIRGTITTAMTFHFYIGLREDEANGLSTRAPHCVPPE